MLWKMGERAGGSVVSPFNKIVWCLASKVWTWVDAT